MSAPACRCLVCCCAWASMTPAGARVRNRYHRIEVLGALASVLSTWLVTGILLYEAVNRILNPSPVNGKGPPPPPQQAGATRQRRPHTHCMGCLMTENCALSRTVLSALSSLESAIYLLHMYIILLKSYIIILLLLYITVYTIC